MKKDTKKIRFFVGRSFLARSISQASLFFLIFVALNFVQIRAQASSGESNEEGERRRAQKEKRRVKIA
jgi:hypothetical protein